MEREQQSIYLVEQITQKNKELYVSYCQKYRFEHDESDLYDEELEKFDPDPVKQPTFCLKDASGSVAGMVSVRCLPYLDDQRRGRFSIIHAVDTSHEAYEMLYSAIEPYVRVMDHLFLFIPESKSEVADILKEIGFQLDRYVWVLDRDDLPVASIILPEGYEIKAYMDEKDAEDWCKVRNRAFATLKGSETPIAEADVIKMVNTPSTVPGGMLFLKKDGEAIGVIRVGKEVEEDKTYAFIGPVAVLPEYQGKGLGKLLLRAGIAFGQANEMPRAMLCVNAENERAADLYLSEGFKKQVVMMCYKKVMMDMQQKMVL